MNDQNIIRDDDAGSEEYSEIIVPNEAKGDRIDKFISNEEDITRSAAVKLLEEGRVLVDGKITPKNYKLRGGEIITVEYPELRESDAVPQNIPLDIVYEDGDIIVII